MNGQAVGAGAVLVVVSHYDRRPIADMERLLASLEAYSAGSDYDLTVVVNRTTSQSMAETPLGACLANAKAAVGARVIERVNLGMNIGAWDAGWRQSPDYQHYVFLQDECWVVRDGWLGAIRSRLADRDVGLVGESLNEAWDRSWHHIRSALKSEFAPDHWCDGAQVDRWRAYEAAWRAWDVDLGAGGRHLRSLVWAASGDALARIGGLLIGRNYGECIAAEVAVSKRFEAAGYRVEQLRPEPFAYLRHLEFNRNHAFEVFTQRSAPLAFDDRSVAAIAARSRLVRLAIRLDRRLASLWPSRSGDT